MQEIAQGQGLSARDAVATDGDEYARDKIGKSRFFDVDTLTMCDLIRCRIHRPRAVEVGREIGV